MVGIVDKVSESLDPSVTACSVASRDGCQYLNSTPLFENEHKYALEWLPNRVVYYFDDIPIHEYEGIGIPQHTMIVVMAMQMSSGYVDTNIPIPQEYQVNYFRYYKLIDDYCGTDANIQNYTQLNRFVFGVRRNITIGAAESSISLSNADNKTFRASNEITIIGEFTVPLGAELNLIPKLCD